MILITLSYAANVNSVNYPVGYSSFLRKAYDDALNDDTKEDIEHGEHPKLFDTAQVGVECLYSTIRVYIYLKTDKEVTDDIAKQLMQDLEKKLNPLNFPFNAR